MVVISIAAHKAQKRENIKKDILATVAAEFDKVHDSNIEAVADKIKDYAVTMGCAYAAPDAAKRQREELRRSYPELYGNNED